MGSSETGSPDHLTIFYSGTVNVFDHVPADKAHAIMLLLSGCSSSQGSSASSGTSNHALLLAAEKTPHTPSTLMASSTSMNTVSGLASITRGASLSFTAAPASIPLARPPSAAANSSNTIAQLQRTQQILAPTRRRSQAELPFARKASLARFLQKRKDRVEETKPEEPVTVDLDADDCKRVKLM